MNPFTVNGGSATFDGKAESESSLRNIELGAIGTFNMMKAAGESQNN